MPNNEWIKNLKPGDKVIIKYNGTSKIVTVEKITPAGNIKAGGVLFNKLGIERNSYYYHYSKSFLAEATPDAIKKCEDEHLVQKAKRLVDENVFSAEKAKVIISMLESSKNVTETSKDEIKALSDFIFSISNSAEVEPVFQSKDGTEVTISKELSDVLNAILEQAFIPYIAKALYEAGYIKSSSQMAETKALQEETTTYNIQMDAIQSFSEDLKKNIDDSINEYWNGDGGGYYLAEDVKSDIDVLVSDYKNKYKIIKEEDDLAKKAVGENK